MVESEPSTGDGTGGDAGTVGSGADAATETDASEDEGGYSVVARAVKTAWGSDSYLMKSYAVVGVLTSAFVVLVVVLAFPTWVSNTIGQSQTATFSRAFLLVAGLLTVVPTLAPMLYALRRRRQGRTSRRRDALLGGSGYLFVLSLYAALLVSAPPEQRDPPPEWIAPVVEFLYGLDPAFAVVPPLVAVVVIVVVGRF